MDHFRKERVVFFKASFLRKTHLSCFFLGGGEGGTMFSSNIILYPSLSLKHACWPHDSGFWLFLAGQCRSPAPRAIHVRQRSALAPPSANPVGEGVAGGKGWQIKYLPIDYTVDGRNPAPIDMENIIEYPMWGGEFGAKIILNHCYLECFAAIKALKPLFETKNHSTMMPRDCKTLAFTVISSFLILLSFRNSLLQRLQMYRCIYAVHKYRHYAFRNAYEKGWCDFTSIEVWLKWVRKWYECFKLMLLIMWSAMKKLDIWTIITWRIILVQNIESNAGIHGALWQKCLWESAYS